MTPFGKQQENVWMALKEVASLTPVREEDVHSVRRNKDQIAKGLNGWAFGAQRCCART